MYFTIPEFGKRTEEQSEALREVGGFAVNIRMLESVPEASIKVISVLLQDIQCYWKYNTRVRRCHYQIYIYIPYFLQIMHFWAILLYFTGWFHNLFEITDQLQNIYLCILFATK